jgi:hypothetical protein
VTRTDLPLVHSIAVGEGKFATPGWEGSSSGFLAVFDRALPSLLKLVAIGYADHPRTVESLAAWAGLDRAEAAILTARLLEFGLVARYEMPLRAAAEPSGKRREVYERDGWACRHCGGTDDLTLDHVVPRSRGGGDEIENLQTLCRPCNSRKGTRF